MHVGWRDHLLEGGLCTEVVLRGEVVGCIVVGSLPSCQRTIQLTVFPEVTVMSADVLLRASGPLKPW